MSIYQTVQPPQLQAKQAPLSVLYVTCSSFSGSTFLSFMLNEHPDIVTVGHTTGWQVAPEDDFLCSCGQQLAICPFFNEIRAVFDAEGLPHDIGDFKTNFRLVKNERFNRYLLAELPCLRLAWLENLRDRIVDTVPTWHRRLALQARANITFIRTAMRISCASVFLDNSHRPHRLRRLYKQPGLNVTAIHLVRDFRGVVLSTMKRRNWSADVAMRHWLSEQIESARIIQTVDKARPFFYEYLCEETNEALSELHTMMGLAPQPFTGDFKTNEHHILGNVMRLHDGKIAIDKKWKTELVQSDIDIIEGIAQNYITQHPDNPVSDILQHYLTSTTKR